MAFPLMKKATAVWLVDNTGLTFRQIAKFCGLHELEVNGIADGEVAAGIRGMDPVSNNQLTAEEIKRCENDPEEDLVLMKNPAAIGEGKRRGPRYTPLSKRQDRPAAIAWLVKFHPELSDSQISKLIGTTKPTIQSIRARTHWNIANFQPIDPVALGLCKQVELDNLTSKLQSKNTDMKMVSSSNDDTDEKKMTIVDTEKSLLETDVNKSSNTLDEQEVLSKEINEKDLDSDQQEIDPNKFFKFSD